MVTTEHVGPAARNGKAAPRAACRICARPTEPAALVRCRFADGATPGPLRSFCRPCAEELAAGLAEPAKSCLRCWRLRSNLQAALLLHAAEPAGVPVLPEPIADHRRGCPRLGI